MWTYLFLLIFVQEIFGNVQFDRSEEEILAEEILSNATQKMESHWLQLRSIFLSHGERQHIPDHLLKQSFNDYRRFTVSLAQNLSNVLGEYPKFHSEALKRRVKLLSHLQISGLNDADYNRSQVLLEAMRKFSKDKNICSYHYCESYFTVDNVTNITMLAKDENVLLHYWKEWRNTISKKARKYFLEYVDLYRKAAWLNGHESASKTWYLDFEENNFLDELSSAMREVLPMYKELHAYMRYLYHGRYGGDLDPYYGPIPDHIMDQIVIHAWYPNPVFPLPNPHHKMENISDKMKSERFTSKQVLRKAAEFYRSLGLQELPSDFWEKYARQKASTDGGEECKSNVYFFPPNVGIEYCPKVSHKAYLQLHGDMAEVQYNLYRNRLPYGLNGEAFSGINDAIGEAVLISASSLRHQQNVQFISTYKEEVMMNRLLRLAIHTHFTLSKYFVMETFWVNALDHKKDAYPDKLNCAFWNVQLELAGISPPEQRSEEHFDPGFKFYRGIDDKTPTTSKIISELLGYQIYKALCTASGQYIQGNKNYPLHNCDFYRSTEAGKLLNDMMSLGSSKHWRDIIEILTGERRISADAFIEYYQPIYDYVKRENIKNGVTVGWDADKTDC